MYICISEVPGPFWLLAGNCGPYTENTSVCSVFSCSPLLVEASGNGATQFTVSGKGLPQLHFSVFIE